MTRRISINRGIWKALLRWNQQSWREVRFSPTASRTPARTSTRFRAIDDVSSSPATIATSRSRPSETGSGLGSVTTPGGRNFSGRESWTRRKRSTHAIRQKRRRDSWRPSRHPTRCKRWASRRADSFNGRKVVLDAGDHMLARRRQRSPSTDRRQTADRCCQYCNRKHALRDRSGRSGT